MQFVPQRLTPIAASFSNAYARPLQCLRPSLLAAQLVMRVMQTPQAGQLCVTSWHDGMQKGRHAAGQKKTSRMQKQNQACAPGSVLTLVVTVARQFGHTPAGGEESF